MVLIGVNNLPQSTTFKEQSDFTSFMASEDFIPLTPPSLKSQQ